MAERPAKLAGLSAKKGAIAAGRDADLVVLDPEREAGSRTLDVHVSRLRKKLAEASGGTAESSPIETVWGIGYRLRAEVP